MAHTKDSLQLHNLQTKDPLELAVLHLLMIKQHLCIGLSGGSDSVSLLYACKNIGLNINAIHINHNLSKNSDDWEYFCSNLCKKLDIELTVIKVNIQNHRGIGIEAAARNIRYTEYKKIKSIVLAHHADDQIETSIIQILRGSDIHNIAGMHKIKTRDTLTIYRPFINVTKKEIIDYIKKNNIEHIEDESNINCKYLRNFVRHNVIPILQSDRYFSNKIHQTINNFQNSAKLLDEFAEIDLQLCLESNLTINLTKLINMSPLRIQNVISYFIRYMDLPLPSCKRMAEFTRQILVAKQDKSPSITIKNQYILKKIKMQLVIDIIQKHERQS